MEILVVALCIGIALKYYLPSKRKALISHICTDLETYLVTAPQHERYAVGENIRFFLASRHFVTFLYWQLFHAPRIDADKLLEIADLGLLHWEERLYKDLRWVERKDFPGLLKPLVNTLESSDARVLLDIGCGAMEVERQVVLRDARRKVPKPRVFIGVDLSSRAYDMICDTFRHHEDKVSIHTISSLSHDELSRYVGANHQKHIVLFLQSDATKLALRDHADVDVVYSSKFKHHLRQVDKHAFDESIKPLATVVLEFDDYRSPLSWVPLTITAWKRPVLLNGALLSRLRQPSKRSLDSQAKTQTIRFYSPPGSYIRYLKP